VFEVLSRLGVKMRIKTVRDLFLGRWIPPGTPGVLLMQKPGTPYWWVLLDGDRKVYVLAPASFRKVVAS